MQINDTQTMSDMPAATAYHRWLGWHAPDLRRAGVSLAIGVIIALLLMRVLSWGLSLVGGWDAAAMTFLVTTWAIIARAGGEDTQRLAMREDTTRGSSAALLIGASIASLLGAGFVLHEAGHENGRQRAALVGLAVLTVGLSWLVTNTVYTLRYANLHFATTASGIAFPGLADRGLPGYRDFAYVAFTIGMCYQVSDTALGDPQIRRTALSHAIVSYLFGVVIVAGSVNLISGLVR
jgi:uncharacterized membrane protein